MAGDDMFAVPAGTTIGDRVTKKDGRWISNDGIGRILDAHDDSELI